jgi:hypothetical protein
LKLVLKKILEEIAGLDLEIFCVILREVGFLGALRQLERFLAIPMHGFLI